MNRQLDLFEYDKELLKAPIKYVKRCKAKSVRSSTKAINFINKNPGQAVQDECNNTPGTRPEGLTREDKKNYDKW